jgi:hypothetical protein
VNPSLFLSKVKSGQEGSVLTAGRARTIFPSSHVAFCSLALHKPG